MHIQVRMSVTRITARRWHAVARRTCDECMGWPVLAREVPGPALVTWQATGSEEDGPALYPIRVDEPARLI